MMGRAMVDIEKVAKQIVDKIKNENPSAAVNVEDVCDDIAMWKKLDALKVIYSEPTAKYVARVLKCIDELQGLLAGRPNAIHPTLLFREERTKHDWQDFLITAERRARMRLFEDIIAGMREQCHLIVDGKIGVHGNSEVNQEHAAYAAASLMVEHRLPLAYSSHTSAYRRCSLLFLEAITGRPPKESTDMRRACERVARTYMADYSDEKQNTCTETAPKN